MKRTRHPAKQIIRWRQQYGGMQAEDDLAGEQFGGQADHNAKHRQAAVPGFGRSHETEAGGTRSHA